MVLPHIRVAVLFSVSAVGPLGFIQDYIRLIECSYTGDMSRIQFKF